MGMRKVVPIYIQLYGAFDVHSLLISFRTKLLEELVGLYRVKTGFTPSDLELQDQDKSIKTILTELIRNHDVEGFLIFIDELHKGELDTALRFMGLIQTFKAELIHKSNLINVGFMIVHTLVF